MQASRATRSGSVTRRILLLALLLIAGTVLLALNHPTRTESLAESTGQAAGNGFQRLRNLVLGPPRIGLQVGHLDAEAHPEELARLRVSTGGLGGGMQEVDVNRAVAAALAERLERRGIAVDLLPATVPPRYRAELVVAIHADSSLEPGRRGYKSAVFRPVRNRWDERLKRALDSAYLAGSSLPDDDANVTGDMLEYYAFNGSFRHSVARRTPAAIVEIGYLSHPSDRELLRRPDRVAALLEEGITAFLEQRGRLGGH
ncbi:MAG: N-acetylmuramoyl-L-alanine amidase [Trueperaceae bacterium]